MISKVFKNMTTMIIMTIHQYNYTIILATGFELSLLYVNNEN